jgi:alpha-tubulin suppressor-like RCC1 family protein
MRPVPSRIVRAAGVALIASLAGCDPGVVAPVDEDGGFLLVTVGIDHSCGVTAENAAFCWGAGIWGQTGTGQQRDEAVPARVAGNTRFTTLSAGALHTCGLDVEGRAHCWGVNIRGQLGLGSTVSVGTPVAVVTDARFTDLSSGWLHTCAATADGDVYCWGHNGQHQVGVPDREDQVAPRRVETALRFDRVTAGSFHTCGLTPDGRAFCWGANNLGQLGDGTAQDAAAPRPVVGDHLFGMISAGHTHTCGVTLAGIALCWGSSVHGELGTAGLALPGLAGAVQPQAVAQGHPFRSVSAGYHATCALAANNRAWCWGHGADGQLGIGSVMDHTVPQPLAYSDHAVLTLRSVSTGVTHTCGVAVTNVAWCWGRGRRGQLGSASTTYSVQPLRVSGKP